MSFTVRAGTITCDTCTTQETSTFRTVLDQWAKGHRCVLHRPPLPRRPPRTTDHDTEREYRAHLRHGEQPCDGCRAAHRTYNTRLALAAAARGVAA